MRLWGKKKVGEPMWSSAEMSVEPSASAVPDAGAVTPWSVSECLSANTDDVSADDYPMTCLTAYVPGGQGVVSVALAQPSMSIARQGRLTESERELIDAAARIVGEELERKAAAEQQLKSEQGKRRRAMKLEGDI